MPTVAVADEVDSVVYQFKEGTAKKLGGYSPWSVQGAIDYVYGTVNGEWYYTRQQESDHVVIMFPAELAPEYAEPFVEASAFWNRVIGETPLQPISSNSPLPFSEIGCATDPGATLPGGFAFKLIILAVVSPIDGVNGVLGSAGACFQQAGFPRVGRMTFDSDDVDNLIASGGFDEVIKHEMGHVIGIGQGEWRRNVANPCTQFNPCNTNPTYVGANGLEGYRDLGGTGDLEVANTGGGGTANAHWREDTFRNELMTGFLSAGRNPFSIMSAKSLIDAGYSVDLSTVEDYTIPGFAPVVLPTEAPPTTDPPTPSPSATPTEFPTDSPIETPTVSPTVDIPDPTPPTTGTTPTTTPEPTIDLGNDVDPTPPGELTPLQEFFLFNKGNIIVGAVGLFAVVLLVIMAVVLKKSRSRRRRNNNARAVEVPEAIPVDIKGLQYTL